MNNKILPHDHGNVSDDIRLGMPNERTFESVSELFKLMSDGKRAQIFWLLCHCEECVINISALTEMSGPAVSHHLKLLKNAGLVISRREGKEVYYTAAPSTRARILHDMLENTMELDCPSNETFDEGVTYDSQVKIVVEIHKFLTEDLTVRHTIDELALKYHINSTTLKTTFKTVFGKPIASYMKEYRIKRATEMILQGNGTIAEISLSVGYENQSKFTKAFKDITGILPKDYKRIHLLR